MDKQFGTGPPGSGSFEEVTRSALRESFGALDRHAPLRRSAELLGLASIIVRRGASEGFHQIGISEPNLWLLFKSNVLQDVLKILVIFFSYDLGLLKGLTLTGIRGLALEWFWCYLRNSLQMVEVNFPNGSGGRAIAEGGCRCALGGRRTNPGLIFQQ